MSRFLSVLTVAALAVSSLAARSSATDLARGTIELEPNAQFLSQSFSFSGESGSTTVTTLSMLATLGWFMNDQFELVGSPVVTYQSFESVNGTSFGLLAGARFNFKSQGNIIPFVGAAVGLEKFSGDLYGTDVAFTAPRVEAGMRFMMGGVASVNFAGIYQHETTAQGIKDLSSNDFALSVGVSVFPGHGK